MAINFGSQSGSSFTNSRSSSFTDPYQQPFLDFSRNLGLGLTQLYSPGAGNFASGAGASLYSQGQALLGGVVNNPFLSSLQGQAGGNPELVNQQVGQLGNDLGRFFNQQILPGISRDFTGLNALGGSRQAIAEGFGAQNTLDAFQRGATDIYTQDAQRSLQAAIGGGNILNTGAATGFAGLENVFNAGLSQFTGPFAPLALFADILGAPTVLDRSSTNSNTSSSGFKLGFG